jgi:hypothetical protein
MSSQIWKMVKVARRIASSNPLLAYELERYAVAVINPEARSFEQNLENTVSVLKSLKEELENALKELDSSDAEEFAKFFDDATEAESEELKRMLKKVSSTAGVKDFFKGLFKKKKPKEKPAEDDGPAGMEPSYQMDESTMDEFVEGKRSWADPGHYVEQEAAEHKEFTDGVKKVLKDMDKARTEPSKGLVNGILKEVSKLIRHGENLVKGIRKHLLEPAAKVEITEEGLGEKKPAKKKISPDELSMTVTNYGQSLLDAAGDEKKTISLLKELFSAVEPSIKEDRASLASRRAFASVLTRIAHANPELRPALIPVIKRSAGIA